MLMLLVIPITKLCSARGLSCESMIVEFGLPASELSRNETESSVSSAISQP
jgi:hypothetical protein